MIRTSVRLRIVFTSGKSFTETMAGESLPSLYAPVPDVGVASDRQHRSVLPEHPLQLLLFLGGKYV